MADNFPKLIIIEDLLKQLDEHETKAHESGLKDLEDLFASAAHVIRMQHEIISEESYKKFKRGIDPVGT